MPSRRTTLSNKAVSATNPTSVEFGSGPDRTGGPAGAIPPPTPPATLAAGLESLYQAIGESIDYGVWVCEPDGRNSFASKSFLNLVGLTQEECSNFGWRDVLHPDEAEQTIRAWQECVRTGGKWDREIRMRGVDGRWHNILVRGVPVEDAAGRIRCWAGINLDITEWKKNTKALRASEERHRLLAVTMLQGVVHQDANGQIIAINPAAERILGKSREQLLGSSSHGEASDTIREDGSHFPDAEHPSVVALRTGREQRAVVMGVFNPQRQEYRWINIDSVPVFRPGHPEPAEVYAVFEDITERKRTADALEESELRFRHIADAAPVMMWLCDPAKKCTWVNKPWLEFTGRSMDEERSHDRSRGIHPEDQEKHLAFYTSFDARKPFEVEYRLLRRDGEYRWLLDRGVPRFAPGGAFLGYIGTCVDLTGHKQAIAAAQSAHDRLQNVLGSITDGLVVMDKDWCFTYFSEQAARILGLPGTTGLLGGCIWDLFPSAAGTQFYDCYHRAVSTGQAIEFEEYYPEPINKWLSCHCYPSSEGLSVYFHDITERKRAEETQRQNAVLFRTLIEQAPMGVYVVDADLRMQQVNTQAMPHFARVESLIRRNIQEIMEHLWGSEIGTRVADSFRHTLGTGERYISPPFTEMRRDLGVEKSYEWETQRVTLPDGRTGVVCYFHDTTERMRSQKALTESESALRATQAALQRQTAELELRVAERTEDLRNTNEQLETFVYSVAHDLRAPLRAMTGFSQALVEDYTPALEPAAQEMLARIQKSAEFMDKLLLDLLAFGLAARAEMELGPVNVQAAWDAALFHCAADIEQRQARIESTPPLPWVHAHAATLVQILSNLLNNALKFVAPGTLPSVRFWAEANGSCIRLSLQDNGIGIAAAHQQRAFRVFERLNGTRYEGTGIGLSIVRKAIERMGGSVGLESTPGHGSRFWVELKQAIPTPNTSQAHTG